MYRRRLTDPPATRGETRRHLIPNAPFVLRMSVSKLSLSPFAAPSPMLAHFNRLISSASGTDKVFMLYACPSHRSAANGMQLTA